jgi:hypothetical protein
MSSIQAAESALLQRNQFTIRRVFFSRHLKFLDPESKEQIGFGRDNSPWYYSLLRGMKIGGFRIGSTLSTTIEVFERENGPSLFTIYRHPSLSTPLASKVEVSDSQGGKLGGFEANLVALATSASFWICGANGEKLVEVKPKFPLLAMMQFGGNKEMPKFSLVSPEGKEVGFVTTEMFAAVQKKQGAVFALGMTGMHVEISEPSIDVHTKVLLVALGVIMAVFGIKY